MFRPSHDDCEEALAILELWGCSNQDCKEAIGFNRQDLTSVELDSLSDEQAEKVFCILRIEELLSVIFSNTENTNRFMELNNSNPFFNGKKPIDILIGGDIEDFRAISQRLDVLAASIW